MTPDARPLAFRGEMAGISSTVIWGGKAMVRLTINGRSIDVDVNPSTPLLWAIREQVGNERVILGLAPTSLHRRYSEKSLQISPGQSPSPSFWPPLATSESPRGPLRTNVIRVSGSQRATSSPGPISASSGIRIVGFYESCRTVANRRHRPHARRGCGSTSFASSRTLGTPAHTRRPPPMPRYFSTWLPAVRQVC